MKTKNAKTEATKPSQKNPCGHDCCAGSCPTPNPQKYVKYGDTVPSRLGGKPKKISFGPLPGGLACADVARLSKKDDLC